MITDNLAALVLVETHITFPSIYKTTIVILIHKREDAFNQSQYKPINLILTLAIILNIRPIVKTFYVYLS